MRNRERIVDGSWVAICCIATFFLKLWAHGARFNPGHGDTCYYFHVAENLYKGRGFVCDYVWSYLENPSGIVPPGGAPSNAWWMPGPSIISFIGMWLAGAATFATAIKAMAFFTSLYPAVVWWTAKVIFNDRILAARAALISVAFHLLVDQPAVTLSHGPYGMIVGAALVLLAIGPLTIKRGILLGTLVGLGHYFRGDALTLFGTAGLLAIVRVRRDGFINILKPLGVAVVAYILIMSPWFARNMIVFGSPMAPGPGKALFLRDYTDWFGMPDRLTFTKYKEHGYGPLIAEKTDEAGDALHSYFSSYFDPTLTKLSGTVGQCFESFMIWIGDRRIHHPPNLPPPWQFLRHFSIWMSILTFAGLAMMLIGAKLQKTGTRWIAVFGIHSLAEIVFYAILFTGVASQSYVSSLYSLYPLFIVGMAAACDPIRTLGIRAARPLAIGAGAVAWILVVMIAAVNALGIGAYLRTYKGPEYYGKMQQFRELGRKLREAGFNEKTDRVMIVNTWDLFAADPISCVRIPDEALGRVLEVAKKTGVRWLLINDPPSPEAARSIPLRRRYRLEIYKTLDKGEYFWRAFDYPPLMIHAIKISQRALDNPWGVLR